MKRNNTLFTLLMMPQRATGLVHPTVNRAGDLHLCRWLDLSDNALTESGHLSFSLRLQTVKPTFNGAAMRDSFKAKFAAQVRVFFQQPP
jgi:hypothetical protein